MISNLTAFIVQVNNNCLDGQIHQNIRSLSPRSKFIFYSGHKEPDEEIGPDQLLFSSGGQTLNWPKAHHLFLIPHRPALDPTLLLSPVFCCCWLGVIGLDAQGQQQISLVER